MSLALQVVDGFEVCVCTAIDLTFIHVFPLFSLFDLTLVALTCLALVRQCYP